MKKIIIVITLILICAKSIAQDISGVWHGIATASNSKKITFVFKIDKLNKTYNTTMSVPTFNVAGMKPQKTTFVEGNLIIDGSNLGMSYKGFLNPKSNVFEGVYKEGKMQLKLNLSKGNPKNEKLNRPQEPTKPYPYHSEDIKFQNKKANIILTGSFTRPSKVGIYPVVVLISGSGKHDRNGSMMTHRPFLVLADYLTKKGIAVLRYDDRGFGESEGNYEQATTADFANDVLSAVAYLKTRKDVDAKSIGLIGHSEGGIIAPLAANLSDDIAFMISMAGTGILGKEVAVLQSKTLRPFPVQNEAEFEQNVRKALDIVTSNRTNDEKKEALYVHNLNYLKPILKSLGAKDEDIAKFINNETQSLLKPWNQFFYNYNPAVEFEKLKIPVLSLIGDKDVQVNAKINQEAIRVSLEKGENSNYKVITLPNLNHLFQECKTCTINEYRDIEQTIAPLALNVVSSWIEKIINN